MEVHKSEKGFCGIAQRSPTLGLQMFLDFNSQKFWPAEVVVRASGSCSPRTSGGPRLGTTGIANTGHLAPIRLELLLIYHTTGCSGVILEKGDWWWLQRYYGLKGPEKTVGSNW